MTTPPDILQLKLDRLFATMESRKRTQSVFAKVLGKADPKKA